MTLTLSADERGELAQLYARYCQAVDDFDAALAVDLFTADGAFRRANTTPAYPDARDWVGRAELQEYFGSRQPGPSARQHWVNLPQLTRLDEKRVDGRASFCIMEAAPTGPAIVALGSYRDDIVYEGGRWLFRTRDVTFL